MLNLINSLAHGFVAVPVVLALRQRGGFDRLAQGGPLSAPALAQALRANEGHLRAALRLLQSLGWLRCEGGRYTLTRDADGASHVPAGLLALYAQPAGSAQLLENPELPLVQWLHCARRQWDLADERLATWLDGALLVPLLFALRARGLPRTEAPLFPGLDASLEAALLALLHARGWCTRDDAQATLTAPGAHLFERLLNLGVTASYTPLLARLPQLLFGDARAVFDDEALHAETHLDRRLNVVASGFQHEKYFEAFAEAVESVFDRLPLDEQPCAIADMGCGDGTLLLRLYRHVARHTARGRALATHPLTLVGVDFHQEALDVAAATLREAGVPHRMLLGDVGDPARLQRDLRALPGIDADRVLHVRSFLDHDRPWQAPPDTPQLRQRLQRRARAAPQGVFVAADGSAIEPALALEALREHLARWAPLAGRHGLLLLEVHCLDPDTTARHLELTESLHFDALQAFSRQQLVEAPDFLLAAAGAGLFPRPGFPQRYPRTLPFCRITLSWFEPRPYSLRLAGPEDLAALCALEAACWPEALRTDAAALQQRLATFARGQCVIEVEGRVVAAIYTQRVADPATLAQSGFAQAPRLHRDDGEWLQLLAVNVLPEVQHLGLGDQLLEWMLQYASLLPGVRAAAGVTRCLQFTGGSQAHYEQYVRARQPQGDPLDPVLAFHHHHGARIERVLPGWRPRDEANLGCGVLITYDLLDRRPAAGASQAAPAAGAAGVEACVRQVLGPRREARYAAATPFRDMGLDSLDLLELRTALSRASGRTLDATFFFRCTTPAAVARFLQGDAGAPAPAAIAARPAPSVAPVQPQPAAVVRGDGEEPIAIIGIGCRFPGDVVDADSFWQMLLQGRDCISEAPAQRGNGELAPQRFPARADAPALRLGGWLPRADRFDPAFFGIAPREAHGMDPQQRLLLEVAWDALEHAGVRPDRLAGTATGVFVGLFGHDYEALRQAGASDGDLDIYFSTGVAPSVAAGRLAYVLGLRGPALAIDTACSSSLVALHLACRSLRAGESRVALAGGVNLILAPQSSIAFARAGMLSPDGRCRTFDRQACGYVRAEGCGLVVLKPLAAALADGDRVIAVVRGSAVNQDGRSNGLTAPNGAAQEDVIRAGLRSAGVPAQAVGYVEAHGTGTALGDPIEMQALQAAYGAGRTRAAPLVVGSVKTNFGHAEAAAGVAGLIKAALALQHGVIPPSLHCTQPSARLDLEHPPTVVPSQSRAWPQGPRLAGVSSFGYSGTNAHVVLEAPPAPDPARSAAAQAPGPYLLTASAHTPRALAERCASLVDALRAPGAPVAALCDTANARRAALPHRVAVAAADAGTLADALAARAAQSADAPAGEPRIAFLFTGQGAQVHAMGADLHCTEPVFRETLEECEALLHQAGHGDGPRLRDLLYGPAEDARLHQTGWTQPALFAFEVALARLWQSWGVVPALVLGHSVGEYAAACVAGVFSLADGLRLIAARGRLMQALPAGGGMASIRADSERVERLLARTGAPLEIAAWNAPQETVVSGPAAALAVLLQACGDEGLRALQLQTSHAFHSRLLEPMLDDFAAVCAQVRLHAPRLPYVSNLSGALAGDEVATPAYWVAHARQPVRFAQGVVAAAATGCDTFLELGPRPVLANLGRQVLAGKPVRWLASVVPGVPDREAMLQALAGAFEAGADIAWDAVLRGPRPAPVALPPYPFQRERYWLAPARSAQVVPTSALNPHPLLGHRVPVPGPVVLFEQRLGADAPAFVREHRLHGQALLPAAAVLQIALAAAAQVGRATGCTLHGLALPRALELTAGRDTPLQCLLWPQAGDEHGLRLLAADEAGGWNVHAEARLAAAPLADAAAAAAPASLRARLQPATPAALAQGLQAQGLHAPLAEAAWQALWTGPGEALVQLQPRADAGTRLDAALLAGLAVLDGAAHVLTAIDCFHASAPLDALAWGHWQADAREGEVATASLRLFDAGGRLLAQATGCRFRRLPTVTAPGGQDVLYAPLWDPAPLASASAPGSLATQLQPVADALPVHAELASGLEALASDWLRAGLRTLGLQLAPGERVTTSDLARQLGIAPGQQRLFGRLLQMLAEDGVLATDTDGWRVQAALTGDRDAAETLLADLRQRFPEAGAELQLLARCGRALAAVLQGSASPLGLLFPEDDPGLLTRLYQQGPSFAPLQSLLGATLRGWLAQAPTGRRLRVLEIGAGTGASSAVALAHLPADRCDYVFTDVSAHFLNAARERFAGRGAIDFRRFDVEQPPAGQGLHAGGYDLVIAANVLHATRELRAAVAHAQALLAPGGSLLLLEGTARRRWIDLVFGLLEGWWRFDDSVLRPDHPLLDAGRWRGLLAESGFDAVDVIAPAGVAAAPLPQAVLLARRAAAAGACLLFADAGGAGERLAGHLARAGRTVLTVHPGDAFRSEGPHAWTLDPRSPDDYPRLLARTGPVAEVVHLWTLDTPEGDAGDACTSVLHLAQALVTQEAAAPPPLWIATRGAQPLPGSAAPLAPFQAPVWGLGLALAREHPELACRLVDLDPAAGPDAIDDLWGELQAGAPTGRSGWRAGVRHVARLAPIAPTRPVAPTEAGTHLLTGGTGGIARHLAGWLAGRGARSLVLASRHASAAGDAPWIADLRAAGVQVHLRDVDVGDAGQVAQLVAWTGAHAAPLAGVWHCAGSFSDALVLQQQPQRFREAFRAKALGAWHLHQATRGLPLARFVLCSSAFAVLPAAGLASYAAANAFLDVLAAERRRLGLPALSIDWGPWDDVGMAAAVGPARARQWAAAGLRTLPAERALQALAQVLDAPRPQVAIVDLDTGRLDADTPVASAQPAAVAPASEGAVLAAWRAAPSGQRGQLLLTEVTALAAAVLGFPDAAQIDVRRSLFQLGMDSLTAMELRSRLQRALARPLPATLLMEHGAPAALARHLQGLLQDAEAPPPAAPAPAPAAEAENTPAGDNLAAELARIESLIRGLP